MTARSIRRAQERKAKKLARRGEARLAQIAASSISDAQLLANRANAQLSTGATSDDGKAQSSLNAVRTGMNEAAVLSEPKTQEKTGRTVVLPSDDAAKYQRHIAAYENEFQPVGKRECDLVQSIADTQWRLLRIPSLESGIYALGYLEFANSVEDQDPGLHPGMVEVKTFLKYERQLRNLQLQESRLSRRREKELAELREIQAARKAGEENNVGQALSPVTSHAASPAGEMDRVFPPGRNGFVFSTDTVDSSIFRVASAGAILQTKPGSVSDLSPESF
jgi:hypothetical protein